MQYWIHPSKSNPWLIPIRKGMDRIRLIGLPYAGGGPHIFAPWRNRLSDEVGIYGIQLPGRGRRLKETPLTEVEEIVELVVEAVTPLLDRPFALFGHSMGGLLAFELARSCRRRAGVEPSRLFVSGFNAPQAPRLRKEIHHLDDTQFLDEIRRLGGTPTEILANDELLRLMLPALRADFTAVERYTYRPETPLSCPIIVFGGLHDPFYQRDELDGWREQTTGTFRRHLMPGRHFFLHDSEVELLALIGRELAQIHFPSAQPRFYRSSPQSGS